MHRNHELVDGLRPPLGHLVVAEVERVVGAVRAGARAAWAAAKAGERGRAVQVVVVDVRAREDTAA